ncbi:MAG: hypothetical protein RBR86_03485 [Pseudobdellovibrionaceae bacterium]|nr:hypothetical protein [Pseudobdellovibrionaceae bacterium]
MLYTVLINGLYIEDVFPPNYREDTAPLPLQLYEKVSFHATLQDIKEFLNAANFQLKLESEEFCNFYDTLHSHASELYLEAQQTGQLLFPKSENTKPAPSYSTSEVTPSTFSLATTLHLNENGIPHSEHSPAMTLKDGTEYIDREDSPAIELSNEDGTQHRDNDLPAISLEKRPKDLLAPEWKTSQGK